MAPFLTSAPRLKRTVVVGVFLFVMWVLLPTGEKRLPKRFVSFWKGGRMSTGADILRYIDPLIGTVNGGWILLLMALEEND